MRKACLYDSPSGSATYGDMSLASLLSCLEYELAARHQEAYSCEDVTRLIEEMRKRTGD